MVKILSYSYRFWLELNHKISTVCVAITCCCLFLSYLQNNNISSPAIQHSWCSFHRFQFLSKQTLFWTSTSLTPLRISSMKKPSFNQYHSLMPIHQMLGKVKFKISGLLEIRKCYICFWLRWDNRRKQRNISCSQFTKCRYWNDTTIWAINVIPSPTKVSNVIVWDQVEVADENIAVSDLTICKDLSISQLIL